MQVSFLHILLLSSKIYPIEKMTWLSCPRRMKSVMFAANCAYRLLLELFGVDQRLESRRVIGLNYRKSALVYSSRVDPTFVGSAQLYGNERCLGEESPLSQISHVVGGDMPTLSRFKPFSNILRLLSSVQAKYHVPKSHTALNKQLSCPCQLRAVTYFHWSGLSFLSPILAYLF